MMYHCVLNPLGEEECEKLTLNLSRKQLKKVPKQEEAQNVRVLILDENELQKIDNIDSYLKIEKLSLSKNQLLRMYGVCRLHCLRELNLSFNGILSIEGLKDCLHLRFLNLEGNNIKTIEHLNNNLKLEYLNLAENSITSISDVSFLKNLKELYLHGNRLSHLRQCDKYLPLSLETLTLAKNNISDLNEICTLANLCCLNSITISENPCVSMTANTDGFDHRPFVLNWCMSLKVIDGFVVDPIESLKAEWLYSQGRGRSFRLGEQTALAKYLSSVCPLIGKALENENERKLRLILSKAQHHQRQLQEEISENSNASQNNSPSSGRKKPASRIQSPRFSRLSGRQGSPDSMANSYHGNTASASEQGTNANHLTQMTTSLIENIKNNDSVMSQSLDGSTLNSSKSNTSQESTPRNITPNSHTDQSCGGNPPPTGGPLAAASKMVPVPETLMSPDICPTAVAQRMTVSALSSQIQQTKMNKNKDNRLNSPRIRSPHLKRNPERSPMPSPKKNSSFSALQTNAKQIDNVDATNLQQNSIDNQLKKRQLVSNSMHIVPPEEESGGGSSDDDSSDHINVDKLKTIRNKAAQRCQEMKENVANLDEMTIGSPDTESSAVVIQKIWRGYRTRKKTKDIAEKLLKKRTHEYIEQLTKDMEMTKAQLENERKIQQLQMQAINALWKKVSSMQNEPSATSASSTTEANVANSLHLENNSTAVVNDLTKTCSMLTSQVQQLQGSMRDILNCLTLFCNLPQENVKRLLTTGVAEALSGSERCDSAATQTEIIAVHTPQMEYFPFSRIRPSSLSLVENKQPPTKASASSISNTTTASTTDNAEIAATTTTTTTTTTTQSPSRNRVSLNESGIVSEDLRSTADTENSFNEKIDENEKQHAPTTANLKTITFTTV
ncbi:centrosomal protein of 97 kDa isoform X1 [Glossina fuscipes]|uniref:Centrosomal protein of 97 kDa n=1 Tax=Glossina fuscipes TaxID=7396 RepID=A0A8U0WED9_9MUSC|nr:centrosomal protein of 97 kDa isoform X1 [Glossina fuscipes]